MHCIGSSVTLTRCLVLWSILAVLPASAQEAWRSATHDGTALGRAAAAAMGLVSMEYGQQFVVVCQERAPSRFPYPGPACPQVEGMSFDIHRDNWSSNYLNYDDPQDPSNAGLLTRQTYVSLQLADLAGYKALALLKAHQVTGSPVFLKRFQRTFLQQLLDKQLPSASLGLGATQTFQAAYWPSPQQDVTLDATGAFANSATVAAGADDVLGTADDVLTWRWNGHAAFNFAALAEALATYARLEQDARVVQAVDRAGQFLLRLERQSPDGTREGSWAYAIAPTNGFPNRMTTGLVALTLLRLSELPGLPSAAQFHAAARRAAVWLRQQSALELDVVSAGAELQVLLEAGETAAATTVADALLARMTTPPEYAWGNHQFGTDSHAVGGISSPWGSGSFQSPWFATYNVAGLLALGKATGTPRYSAAADLLARWLGDKLVRSLQDAHPVPVQDLRGGVTSVYGGTWWGLYPETYEPNTGTYVDPYTQTPTRTVPSLILEWVNAPQVDLAQRPQSWLEAHVGVDFERVLYERVREDSYYAHISGFYPWQGWSPLPRNLGEVSPSINPLLADDAALALLDYALLR
jgi:hypothetical protein